MWIIPLLATLISLFFALILTDKFIKRKRISDLLYSLSLYMFALASFGEFYSSAFNWFTWLYKLYYYPAISLVPIMAAATLYARFKRIVAHLFLAYVGVVMLLLLIAIIPAQVNAELLAASGMTVGGEAMPDSVRRYSFWLSGVGGIVMILSALWSWWKSRLAGNLVIVGGALIMSIGGRLATAGWTYFLPLSELLGIIAIFCGVILLEKQKYFLKNETDQIQIKIGSTQIAATADGQTLVKKETGKKQKPKKEKINNKNHKNKERKSKSVKVKQSYKG